MPTLSPQPTPDDFIYALAADGQTLFAAATSGLFLSGDAGQSWRLATESLGLSQAVPATSLLLSPEFSADGAVFGGMAGGILRSADGGQTWSLAKMPPPPPTTTAMVISPNYLEDGVMLAGTMEDGILRSADRGWNWTPWNFGLLDLSVFSLVISPDFKADETIFAGTETGIFRSTNGGRAWREVDLPVGFETVLSLAISPHFKADGLLFAGTEGQGLLISADQGVSWSQIKAEALDGPINAVLVSPDAGAQPQLAVLCNGAAWRSADGGQSWSPLWPEVSEETEITALLAPQGLAPGAPVWVGLVGGEVVAKKI